MIGKRKPFCAGLPWLYVFVSSAGAILEDIVDFVTLYTIPNWHDQVYAFVGGASCVLVGTPMVPVTFLWLSSKQCRIGGKAPLIIAAPLILWLPWNFLICGFVSTDYTFNVIQFWLIMAFGLVVWRDSIRNLLGRNNQRKAQKKPYVQLPTHSYGSNL